MTYDLRLLGRFQLLSPAGEAVPISAKKCQVLIALLARAEGAPVPRSRLIDILWGERGEEQARASLRQAFTALRKVFAGAGEIPPRVDDAQATLDLAMISVDSERFCRLHRVDAAGTVALWRGDFLEGLSIPGQAAQDWLQAERQRFQALYLESLSQLMAAHAAAGAFDTALATAQQLLATDPLDEAAQRIVMRALAETGERTRALRLYQDFAERLARDLAAEPAPETRGLYEEIRGAATKTGAAPPQPQPARGRQDAAPQPAAGVREPAESPRIAVLPFENMSGDPAQDYFSDGLTEDIITELSRFKSLFVIARHSSFAYKGMSVDVARVARELGVRYVVEGSLRQAGNRIRVSAQLVDADSGKQLWAERYDRDMEDVFAVQDEITQTIVGTVWGRVEMAGLRRAGRLSPSDLKAYDLTLQGRAFVLNFDKAENARAIEILEGALALDPENANALTTLALAHMMNWMAFWVSDRQAAIRRARALARRAVTCDESDSRAWWQLGEIELLTGHHQDACIALEKAMGLNPNDIEARCVYGMYLAAVGDSEAGLREFEEAKRRNPIDFSWVPWLRGYTQVLAGRYGEAIASFKELSMPVTEAHFWMAVAYAHNGEVAEARWQLDRFLEKAQGEMAAFPGRKAADWEDYCRAISGCTDRARIDQLLDGLRKAAGGEVLMDAAGQ